MQQLQGAAPVLLSCVLAPQAEQTGVCQADKRGFAMGSFAAWSVKDVPPRVECTQHWERKSLLSAIGITGLGTLKQPGCSLGSSETSSTAAAGIGLRSAAGFGSSGSGSLTNSANNSAKSLTQQAQLIPVSPSLVCPTAPRLHPHSSISHIQPWEQHPPYPSWAHAGTESSGGCGMSSSSATAVCVPCRCC